MIRSARKISGFEHEALHNVSNSICCYKGSEYRIRKKKSSTPTKMNRNMSAPKGRSFSHDAKSAHGSLFFRRSLFKGSLFFRGRSFYQAGEKRTLFVGASSGKKMFQKSVLCIGHLWLQKTMIQLT